jgi:hypothetical protein
MMSNFWWGQRGTRKKMHWMNWNRLCKEKKAGGIGFRDLQFFNQALLAKQGWRLLKCPESLLQTLKIKVFPNCSFLDATIPTHASYMWRSIAQVRDLIRRGSRWRIGDGENVKIWNDKWFWTQVMDESFLPQQHLAPDATVACLIDPILRKWREATQLMLQFSPF